MQRRSQQVLAMADVISQRGPADADDEAHGDAQQQPPRAQPDGEHVAQPRGQSYGDEEDEGGEGVTQGRLPAYPGRSRA